MNHLKYLEFQRLMKELQFVESDYLYQSEIMRVSDLEFFKSVEIILNQFPELKEIYHRKHQQQMEKLIDANLNTSLESIQDQVIQRIEIPHAKKIYRDIVKSTHPDKITNQKLNNLYLEATEAYDQNDIVTLYKVGSELNIEFDLPDDFIHQIEGKINQYKQKVSFLENTYTYKWLKSDDKDKNKVVVEFIRSRVI